MIEIVEQTSVRLKRALAIRGMKQVELSERSGISEAMISQYVSGRRNPKRNALHAMSKALNVSPVWLMGIDVPMEEKEKSKRDELAEAIKGLTERQAVLLLAFIKTMGEDHES